MSDSIDLTNSDDESCVVQLASRRQPGGVRRGFSGGKSPVKPHDFVDLTSDTPPERRARSRGAVSGKFAIDFDEDGEASAACASAGGTVARSPSKRFRRNEVPGPCGGCSSSAGGEDLIAGCGSSSSPSAKQVIGGGSSSTAKVREKGDAGSSVMCPICSIEMKAGERIFLSCDHWACTDCLSKASRIALF
jgi:hypothetical protein